MAKTKTIITTLLITAIFLAISHITPVMANPITVAISPTSGTVGSTVTVSGTEATANKEVRVYWGDAFMATTTANATGGYSVDITVPDNRAGAMDIRVRDVATGDADSALFIVVPKIVLIPDKGSAWYGGDQITVVGTGFGIHEFPPPQEPWWAPCNVTLEFNGIVWTNVTSTDWDGSFEAKFYVPDTMPNGTYTVNATDDLGNSASAPFTVVPKILSWPTSGSTATHAHLAGWSFAASKSVTVTFDSINVTLFGGLMTDPQGRFGNWFKVPDVPDGIYNITAIDADGNSASAPFVVPRPVMFLTPNTTVGSSIVTVTGLGFQSGPPVVVTINETASMDILYSGMMLMQTFPDEYGSFEFSFVLPVAKPGIYNVTANRMIEMMEPQGFMKIEALTWAPLTLVDLVMDKLIELQGDTAIIQTEVGEIEIKLHNINATLLLIQDDIALIQTDVGTIQADVALINAKLVKIEGSITTINSSIGVIQTDISTINATLTAINGTLVTIQTDIGMIQTDITDIQLNVTAINGNIATIQTTLGTIEGKITSIEGNIATIETDIGTVETDISNVKGAQEASTTPLYADIILALISAVGVIILIISMRRKTKD